MVSYPLRSKILGKRKGALLMPKKIALASTWLIFRYFQITAVIGSDEQKLCILQPLFLIIGSIIICDYLIYKN